ncbi:MAG TPA: hypothetical protein VM326_02305 [Sphingomicrobium sp.]|jgi:hypothetical protein|nr:hypothetical protein [Sphingomicrobium sp.]
MRLIACLALLLATAAAAAPSRLIVARGSWASFDRGAACEAMARPIAAPGKRDSQPYVAVAFDRAGPRRGQLFAQLRRPTRPGSSVLLTIGSQPFLLAAKGAFAWSRDPEQEAAILAAMRSAGGMRIQARDLSGRRMTDRFLLDGAPTAIDAAAAACSRPR